MLNILQSKYRMNGFCNENIPIWMDYKQLGTFLPECLMTIYYSNQNVEKLDLNILLLMTWRWYHKLLNALESNTKQNHFANLSLQSTTFRKMKIRFFTNLKRIEKFYLPLQNNIWQKTAESNR